MAISCKQCSASIVLFVLIFAKTFSRKLSYYRIICWVEVSQNGPCYPRYHGGTSVKGTQTHKQINKQTKWKFGKIPASQLGVVALWENLLSHSQDLPPLPPLKLKSYIAKCVRCFSPTKQTKTGKSLANKKHEIRFPCLFVKYVCHTW